MSDNLDELLAFDPLAAAVMITGASYKDNRGTLALGLAMHLDHNDRKDAALRAGDDTSMRTPWAETKRIYRELGFEVVREVAFQGNHGIDEHLTWWREDGVLATTESFTWKPGDVATNKSWIHYNWRPSDPDTMYQFTSSGRLDPASYDLGDHIWVGDHDTREGLRHKLNQLQDNGQFVTPWVAKPFIWLLNYAEFREDGTSYEERSRARLALLATLPAHVRTQIGVEV